MIALVKDLLTLETATLRKLLLCLHLPAQRNRHILFVAGQGLGHIGLRASYFDQILSLETRPGKIVKEKYAKERKFHHLRRKNEMPQRFAAAVFGGLSVVAPMLIMAINPS